jgi:hypothetical protein
MDDSEVKQAIEAAFAFAQLVAEGAAPDPTEYRDENMLPHPKSLIRVGLFIMVKMQEGDTEKLGWATLLAFLRQFQPNVGSEKTGMGALFDDEFRASIPKGLTPETMTAEDEKRLQKIADHVVFAHERSVRFDGLRATEAELDNSFLERLLGDLWINHQKRAADEAARVLSDLRAQNEK